MVILSTVRSRFSSGSISNWMKKYFAVLKASLQSVVAYRGAALIWVVIQLTELVFLLLIYSVLYRGRAEIGGFTKQGMTAYFLMLSIINKIVFWYPMFMIEEDISKGDLSTHLLKPYSYRLRCFFREFAWRIQYFLISLPFIIIYFLAIKNSFTLTFNYPKNLFFLSSLVLAASTFYLFSQLFGLLSFWLTRVIDLQNLLWVFIWFLGGGIIPISFLPQGLLRVAKLLPSRSIISLPLEILFDRLSGPEVLRPMVIGIVWAVLLFVLNSAAWKKGVKQYEAYGR